MEFIDTPAGARLNRAANEAWAAHRALREGYDATLGVPIPVQKDYPDFGAWQVAYHQTNAARAAVARSLPVDHPFWAVEASYRRAEGAENALKWAGQDWRAQQPGHHAAVNSADGEF